MASGQTKNSCRWLLSGTDTFVTTFVGQTKNSCGTVTVSDTAEKHALKLKAKMAKAAKAKKSQPKP